MALILNPFVEDTFDICPPRWNRRKILPRPRYTWTPYCTRMRRPNLFNPMAFDLFDNLDAKLPTIKTRSKEDSFETFMDMEGFDPKEIEVEVDPDTKLVTVKGSKKGEFFQSVVQRSFTLPDNCDSSKVKTFLGKNGSFQITAPKLTQSVEDKSDDKSEDKVKKIKLGNEVVEIEDIPECDPNAVTKANKAKDVEMEESPGDESKEEKKVLKVPVEVELDEDLEEDVEENGPFQYTMDITDYDPNDIEVEMNANRGILNITATKKIEQDGKMFVREVQKEIAVNMDTFDVSKLECTTSEDKTTLNITAPRRSLANASRKIPIKFQQIS